MLAMSKILTIYRTHTRILNVYKMSLPNRANCSRFFKIEISSTFIFEIHQQCSTFNLNLCNHFFFVYYNKKYNFHRLLHYVFNMDFVVVVSFDLPHKKQQQLKWTEKKHCKIRHWRSTLVLFCHVEISTNWLCMQFTTENPDPAQYTRTHKENEEREKNKSKRISTSISCCTFTI